MPTIADTIARILAVNGVHRIFGLPGGEIAEIMAACRRLGLAFVLTRHENAACIMAGVTDELYDLKTDPYEMTNLVKSRAQQPTIARLRQELGKLVVESVGL